MGKSRLPRIACTVGDFNGIGPEILIKALADPQLRNNCIPVVVGNTRLLREYISAARLTAIAQVTRNTLYVNNAATEIVDLPSDVQINLGTIDAGAGKLAGLAIQHATIMALDHEVQAIVTMPISKVALHLGDFPFPGHTEMIASITGGSPLMILTSGAFRVALATIHVPLLTVPPLITQQHIEQSINEFAHALQLDFGIVAPRIAVLGLNPHAGEKGEFGREELEHILPAINVCRTAGIGAEGPFPADGFFARSRQHSYDGVLAMYHDQGLIPLKIAARGAGVNVTANLPIVRTSPDHGTAYDIVGKGIADGTSAVQAIFAAIQIHTQRSTSQS